MLLAGEITYDIHTPQIRTHNIRACARTRALNPPVSTAQHTHAHLHTTHDMDLWRTSGNKKPSATREVACISCVPILVLLV